MWKYSIPSLFDQTSLENKGFIIWHKVHHFAVRKKLSRADFLSSISAARAANHIVYEPRVKMLLESFSQDRIYAVTCGETKPPKQIFLSYGVKTLTGNVEVICMLNRSGHGVSYSQLEENGRALCLQKLAANLSQTRILPGTIRPYVFTNLAWDNIDHLEETSTRGDTTRRVNGIAV